jgi:hypothetical protein
MKKTSVFSDYPKGNVCLCVFSLPIQIFDKNRGVMKESQIINYILRKMIDNFAFRRRSLLFRCLSTSFDLLCNTEPEKRVKLAGAINVRKKLKRDKVHGTWSKVQGTSQNLSTCLPVHLSTNKKGQGTRNKEQAKTRPFVYSFIRPLIEKDKEEGTSQNLFTCLPVHLSTNEKGQGTRDKEQAKTRPFVYSFTRLLKDKEEGTSKNLSTCLLVHLSTNKKGQGTKDKEEAKTRLLVYSFTSPLIEWDKVQGTSQNLSTCLLVHLSTNNNANSNQNFKYINTKANEKVHYFNVWNILDDAVDIFPNRPDMDRNIRRQYNIF